MKKLVAWLIVVSWVISLNFPAWASAGEYYTAVDNPTHLTLYVQMHLGSGNRHSTTPTFGLSLDRDLNHSFTPDGLWTAARSASLLDLQFNRFGAQGLQVGGAKVMARNGGESVWTNPWLWVGVGAGVLLVSCVSDHFPCSGGGGMNRGGGGY